MSFSRSIENFNTPTGNITQFDQFALGFALSGALTLHDCMVLGVFWKNDVTISGQVLDRDGNVYADCGLGRVARPIDAYLQLLVAPYVLNVGDATPGVIINFSGTATEAIIVLAEYGNLGKATRVVAAAQGVASSGTIVDTDPLNPAVAAGFVVAFAGTDDTDASAGPNFTARNAPAGSGSIFQDRIFTSAIGSDFARAIMSGAMTKGAILAAAISDAPLPDERRVGVPEPVLNGWGE